MFAFPAAVLAACVACVAPGPHGLPVTRVAGADPLGATRYLVGGLRVTRPRLDLPDGSDARAIVTVQIENRSRMPDALVGATVEGAGTTSVQPGPLALPPDGTVDLTPDGPHVAVDGPGPSWKVGDVIKGVLLFDRAGPLAIEFIVAEAAPRP